MPVDAVPESLPAYLRERGDELVGDRGDTWDGHNRVGELDDDAREAAEGSATRSPRRSTTARSRCTGTPPTTCFGASARQLVDEALAAGSLDAAVADHVDLRR